ncbi:MAG: hypothetical protein SFY92_04820 [Verrucomicrobiae bacterium]|nr:hypothetical protein [Verrucomicrobiae bacterium]
MNLCLYRLLLPAVVSVILTAPVSALTPAETKSSRTKSTPSASGKIVVASDQPEFNAMLAAYGDEQLRQFQSVFSLRPEDLYLLRIQWVRSEEHVWDLIPFVFQEKLCFQLIIQCPDKIDQKKLDVFLARVFFHCLAESGKNPGAGRNLKKLPSWVPEGYVLWRSLNDPSPPTHTLRSLILNEGFPTPSLFLTADSNYDVYSPSQKDALQWLWFRSLMQVPKGAALLEGFLRDLPNPTEKWAFYFLKSYKPTFEDLNQLDRWWNLQAVYLTDIVAADSMPPAQVETELKKLLLFPGKTPGTVFPLEELIAQDAPRLSRDLVNEKKSRLNALVSRASPSFATVLITYRDLLDDLAQGRKPSPALLEALSGRRLQLVAYQQQVSDYMNWYIVTQTPADQELFRRAILSYRELESLRAPEKTTEHTPLSIRAAP